jgi:hypothetical protein
MGNAMSLKTQGNRYGARPNRAGIRARPNAKNATQSMTYDVKDAKVSMRGAYRGARGA